MVQERVTGSTTYIQNNLANYMLIRKIFGIQVQVRLGSNDMSG